ncbi:MAG: hypothetical protein L0228_02525 [Planctomycetes bacterium]|nr:hypothetical protein [Planctomycetota bacterium]
MKHLLLVLLALAVAAPTALAQPLPKPQNPAIEKPPSKNPGKPPEFFKARRAALAARKEAAKERMQQFKAARAAAEEKAYQEWHERYIADAPVRVQYGPSQ